MSQLLFPGRVAVLFTLGLLLSQCGKPDPVIQTQDGAEMILIPAGEFLMGGQEEDLKDRPQSGYLNYVAERPRHRVFIRDFYLDKHEVSNAQYRRFLEHIEQTGDTSMNHPDQPSNLGHRQEYTGENLLADNQPAVGLNWFDAYAYCRWAGKRLPTEAEWEYAARGQGEDYRKYPWGNQEPDANGIWRANFRPDSGSGAGGFPFTAPVGSFPDGASPLGILDMAGNAEEWVQDWLSFNYYQETEGARDPQGPPSGKHRVIKGGSYGSDHYHIRIATRLYGPPTAKTEYQGCRCAKNP